MLKRDTTACFEKIGFAFLSRYHFVAGGLDIAMSKEQHARIMARQIDAPVEVGHDEERRRTYWLFRDEFYWEDEGYDETELKALILERLAQKDRRVQRAVALMQQTEAMDSPARAPIPDEVKIFVWKRDGGCCVKCGSNERLEFDHVIPVAMGGANTARNLQLLCEPCNRSKGASLA
jgi:HNH endonuclease